MSILFDNYKLKKKDKSIYQTNIFVVFQLNYNIVLHRYRIAIDCNKLVKFFNINYYSILFN